MTDIWEDPASKRESDWKLLSCLLSWGPWRFVMECDFGLIGCLDCGLVCCCCCCWLGVRGYFSLEKRPRDCGFTNRRNKGLISVDRKTSLLSYLQYPVPYQSRLQRIYRSQCPKGDWMWCWAEAYRYAWTQGAVDIVAFQHRFWLRGVQSLSCRW